ncbi:hypothetical protein AOLI_G00088300 [Acnodon oligacanthus]
MDKRLQKLDIWFCQRGTPPNIQNLCIIKRLTVLPRRISGFEVLSSNCRFTFGHLNSDFSAASSLRSSNLSALCQRKRPLLRNLPVKAPGIYRDP